MSHWPYTPEEDEEYSKPKKKIIKIRYYQRVSSIRWLGFVLAMLGVYILSGADTEIQWIGWIITSGSCLIWCCIGIKDKDTPRALMEFAYLILAVRGVLNWLN
jgi:drug/metabolite transporter (DMT)-like permease